MTSFAPLAPAARPTPPRQFGRFTLRLLLGKSARTMLWLVHDPRNDQELLLSLPRTPPDDAHRLDAWLATARAAARLQHPGLAHVAEIGVHEHWPFVTSDRALGITLPEWLAAHPLPLPEDSAAWIASVLEGLAYAHEGGVVHGDPQLHHLIVDPQGRLRLAGLAAAVEASAVSAQVGNTGAPAAPRGMTIDPALLRAQRDAAQRDVLAIGVLLHQLLAGKPPLDEPDTALVIERLAPVGREAIALPWSTPHALPEPLRAIGNRATIARPRLRYLGARSLQRALDGWRHAHLQQQGGVVEMLLARIDSVGHLPATAAATSAVARLAGVANVERIDEMAAQILRDTALSLELLRLVNTAAVQATQAAGNGPVLTVRRAIALLGTDGIRFAANALRAWPGPLSDEGAEALRRLIERVRFAGHLAQALRPAGYDAEVVYVVAMMQNLGRLLVHYHLAEEADQIRVLMQPEAPADEGAKPTPPLDEVAAAHAVLGVDLETIALAAAKHWSLGPEVQQLMRRIPSNRSVRKPESDADVLRIAASAANDVIDALTLLGRAERDAALERIVQRYARALKIDGDALRDALKSAQTTLRGGAAPAAQPAAPASEAAAATEPASDTAAT